MRVVPEGARKGVGAVFENIELEHLRLHNNFGIAGAPALR